MPYSAMARWLAAILLTHMGVLLLCTCSKSETASKAPLAQHQHLLITGVGAASSMGHLMAESDYSPTVFAGSNLHCPIYSCKYGEIAKDRVFASLVKLSSSMEPLANDSSLIIPGDTQVKDARKNVEESRDYWDLFAYAYGLGEGPQDDFFVVRGKLSALHHDVGNFNDLAKHETSGKEVEEQRRAVHRLMKDFVEMMRSPRWRKYLENPLINELYPRRRSNLARMFWDNAPDELPSLKLTGLQNMAGLCKAYVDKIYTSWQYIKSWSSKDLKRYHNSVHDVRKEIRAMNYTSSFFPEIWINSTFASESKGALRSFYDVYSKVQTHLELYIFHIQRGHRSEADLEARRMQAAWDQLIQWQESLNEDERLLAMLRDMSANIMEVPAVEVPAIFPRWLRVAFLVVLPVALVYGAFAFYKSWKRNFAREDGYQYIN